MVPDVPGLPDPLPSVLLRLPGGSSGHWPPSGAPSTGLLSGLEEEEDMKQLCRGRGSGHTWFPWILSFC